MDWLPTAKKVDLHPDIGNGAFDKFLGVILHVNQAENGTPDSFWGNGNSGQVCPNFQVYKDGSIHQMLPLNWQPWCQKNGNFNYAAIETAGLDTEPLTDAQLTSCALILAAYHTAFPSMPLSLANAPGQAGLGIHGMGGDAWGGHPNCPGTIRSNQRGEILKRTNLIINPPKDVLTMDEATLRKIIHDEVTKVINTTPVEVRGLSDYSHKAFPTLETFLSGIPGYKSWASRQGK